MRGRMIGRSRGSSPATAVGRHEAAAPHTIRRRSRLAPALSSGAQEGRPEELQGKTAGQGQEARAGRRRTAESVGAGSGSVPGAESGSRGAPEPTRHRRTTNGRR
eukprot:4598881-Heterocapsa_arctica.AAC.1